MERGLLKRLRLGFAGPRQGRPPDQPSGHTCGEPEPLPYPPHYATMQHRGGYRLAPAWSPWRGLFDASDVGQLVERGEHRFGVCHVEDLP
ncbi:hypothetical protein SAMN05421505_12039 [Sinosporangium album]|uniref:Uncharacterized protein n=1 Tax=Sinosporangium album TaxID=504805 RepID=A0A1G8ED15_9ACTN|nr:hypothetical protein SAMN05421505_12039 [Sinosporangium album]